MTRDEDWAAVIGSRTSRVALGNGIRSARRLAGLTQDQIAVQLDLTITKVRQLESGAVAPDPGHIIHLCKVFGCQPAVIVRKLSNTHARCAANCLRDVEPDPDIASLFNRNGGSILAEIDQVIGDHFRVGQALTQLRNRVRKELSDAQAHGPDDRRDPADRGARDAELPEDGADRPAT